MTEETEDSNDSNAFQGKKRFKWEMNGSTEGINSISCRWLFSPSRFEWLFTPLPFQNIWTNLSLWTLYLLVFYSIFSVFFVCPPLSHPLFTFVISLLLFSTKVSCISTSYPSNVTPATLRIAFNFVTPLLHFPTLSTRFSFPLDTKVSCCDKRGKRMRTLQRWKKGSIIAIQCEVLSLLSSPRLLPPIELPSVPL